MKFIDTEIEGLKIIEPDVFGDARGWFCEMYNVELILSAKDQRHPLLADIAPWEEAIGAHWHPATKRIWG